MQYTHEVQNMCCVAKGPNHGPAPIPEEGKWVYCIILLFGCFIILVFNTFSAYKNSHF